MSVSLAFLTTMQTAAESQSACGRQQMTFSTILSGVVGLASNPKPSRLRPGENIEAEIEAKVTAATLKWDTATDLVINSHLTTEQFL